MIEGVMLLDSCTHFVQVMFTMQADSVRNPRLIFHLALLINNKLLQRVQKQYIRSHLSSET